MAGSIRLTHEHRMAISTAAADTAYAEEYEAIKIAKVEFGKIVAEAICKQYEKQVSEMKKLTPRNTPPSTERVLAITHLYVVIHSEISMPGLGPAHINEYYNEPIMFPDRSPLLDATRRMAITDQTLFIEAHRIIRELGIIERTRNAIQSKVLEITKKASTLGGLAKLWPTGVQFFPLVEQMEKQRHEETLALCKDVDELILLSGVELEE